MRSKKGLFSKLFGSKGKTVGLALGSGGLWGLAHIGVLKVLEEEGIPIDYVVGCSMGSVIGAAYALNPDSKELEERAESFGRFDLIRFMDITLPTVSLLSGGHVQEFVESLIDNRKFSDTKIPLDIIATDLKSGEEVIYDDGELLKPVMGSISIPGIFPPVKYKDKILVDGGVVNPTPMNVARERGYDVIIGVDLTMKDEVSLSRPNIVDNLLRSYEIIRNRITRLNINDAEKNYIVIKPDVSKLRTYKSSDLDKFIAEGERVTRAVLPEIRKMLKK